MNHRTEPIPGSVPFADVRTLLDAVEAVLDLPKHGATDSMICRYAFTSGVLSTVEDDRGIAHSVEILRKLVDSAQNAEEAGQ